MSDTSISARQKAWNDYKAKLKEVSFRDWFVIILIAIGKPAIPFIAGFYFATEYDFYFSQIFMGFMFGLFFFWVIQLWALSD